MDFLDANAYQLLLTFHLLGLALGIGGATITDFTFLRAFKENRITPETVARMKVLSQVVWTGLGILALSGLGLFFLSPNYFLASPGFLAKITFVLVITINGLFLNFYATSRLSSFTFTDKYSQDNSSEKARKLSFFFGSISLVSWYATFFIATLKSVFPLPYYTYIGTYLAILLITVTLGQIIEKRLSKKRIQTNPQTPPYKGISSNPYSNTINSDSNTRSNSVLDPEEKR